MSLRPSRYRAIAALGLAWALGWTMLRAQQPSAPLEVEFGDAVLRDWVQPQYPAEAAKEKSEGQVTVEFIVEPDGRVTAATVKESTDARFDEAALAAVRQWVFLPAVEDGKTVRSALTVPVQFSRAQLKQTQVPISPPEHLRPRSLKLTPAKARNAPDPEYPGELEERKLPGRVNLEFTVDPAGRPGSPRVLWASHPAFVESALRTIEKWEFEPAHQGPLAKAATIQSPMEFSSLTAKRADILAANQLTVLSGTDPTTPPGPFVMTDPVYPLSRLLAREPGSVTAEFRVDERGGVSEVAIKEATGPDYAAALMAAMEAWAFEPALEGTGRTAVRLQVVYKFTPPDTGPVARLAEAMRPGGGGVGVARGLDQSLKPLWRGFPVYPAALREARPTGQAAIEFIIDRDGRVRLPRIVSATREEFGWAAATAVSQWVFERPRRQGEPVDVRVSIPVQFAPPTE